VNHLRRPAAVEIRVRPGLRLERAEVEILRRLAAGHDDPEIALALEISGRTLRRRMAGLLRKLDARTRAHAVAIGVQQNLVVLLPGGSR
jgi:DNA-binding CsgD family transcriptional regulator